MKIFLAGQRTLSNRGCEALVVSTIQMFVEINPKVFFIIPSTDISRDEKALSKYDFDNYTFVLAPDITWTIKLWNRLVRLLPFVASVWVPSKLHWNSETLEQIKDCDRVLHIGGDNFSYDYSFAGLISNTAQIDFFAKKGTPQEIWCATVGPFDSCAYLEKRVIEKLKKLTRITVREMESRRYLNAKGVSADLNADPAFNLKPENTDSFSVASEKKHIVVNLSPYIYRNTTKTVVDSAIQSFVRKRLDEGYEIILLSHVNTETSSDSLVIRTVLEDFLESEHVHFVPEDLMASQFKGIVAGADFVVASRTHVTIAGFSSLKPVLSIGYSAKASRLNSFLFGHESYVLKTQELTSDSLEETFQRVAAADTEIRTTLSTKVAELRKTFKQLCESTIKE